MRIRLLGHYFHVSIAVLAVVEALLFAAALYAAVLLRYHSDVEFVDERIRPVWPRAVAFSVSTIISFLALGLYTARQRARIFGLGLRISLAVAASMILTGAVFYMIPDLAVGRGVVAIAAGLSLASSLAVRSGTRRMVDAEGFKKRVLVLGYGSPTRCFERLRRRTDRLGYHLVGYVRSEGETLIEARDARDRVFELCNEERLPALCRRLAIDEVVVAMEDRRRQFPGSDLLECRLAGIHVIDIASFLERETARVYLDVLKPSWIIFGSGYRRDAVRLFSSRAFDIAASSLLLLLTLPVSILTAFAIWLDDRGPVFYRQERVGLGGCPFGLLKFRSMRTDAEAGGAPQWAQDKDPRVTRVGSFIRRCRIDELPQLLNVLRGEMSFVGPRPERPHFVAELSEKIPFYGQRHTVKPGITGWAQLCYRYGASEADALQKLQYDLYYVKNNSLLFDLAILVQTAEVIFMGKGAR